MKPLLALSRAIDLANEHIGRLVYWCVLIMVLVSAANATSRYALNMASNAWLELQWYLFSAVFLLCAGYTLLHNEHVRIDVIASRLSKRTQIWLDVIGFVLFLTPMCCAMLYFGTPFFLQGLRSGEMSGNAGGLIRWPVYMMIPIGFSLLLLQCWSELIKRIAYLKGLIEDPTAKKAAKSAEEELAEEIARLAEAKSKA